VPEHNVRTAGKFESKIECCDNGLCAIRHKVVTLPHNRPQRDWITIAVADNGIGMTPEQMGKLFQVSGIRDHREQVWRQMYIERGSKRSPPPSRRRLQDRSITS
jgi:hypothetical protein